MESDQQSVISDIESYVARVDRAYSRWYIGIASDPRQRLFNDHAVDEKSGAWILRGCASSAAARDVENHFVRRGMKGGPGGGDPSTKSVYAYKITMTTIERN